MQSQDQQLPLPQFEEWLKPQKEDDPSKKFCSECTTKQEPLYYIFQQFYICQKCFMEQQNLLRSMKLEKIKSNQLYPQIDQIMPNLFLGNQDAAIDRKTHQKHGIKAVLVCGNYLMMPHKELYQYKQFNIADNPLQRIDHLFDETYEWIKQKHNQDKKVFIHCAAGISRSSSFTIAFLMKDRQMGFQQARKFVKQRRSYIKPNSGFVEQLMNYQKKLYDEKVKELTGKFPQKQQK